MSGLRIALLGAGMIGRAHAAILSRLPAGTASLVGVADPAPASATFVASLGVPHFAAIDDLLEATRPDAAIIATPNLLHGPHAHACIDRGIGILIEKPMAETVATAQAIADHADAAGVKLLVGQFRRHNPVVQAAREAIASGRLGRLVSIEAASTVLKPDAYYEIAWRTQPGGGPILINLVHDIDALRYLCGEIQSVQAMVGHAARGHAVEDTAAVLLRFANGALGTVILSDATPSPFCWDQTSGENPLFVRHTADAYRISGADATLELPSLTLWHYPGRRGWDQALTRETLPVTPADPLEQQTLHFLRVVRGEVEPMVSGRDGARTVAATLAVAESAASGTAITPAEPPEWR